MVWLLFLLSIIGTLFWFNDWIYRLPTPVPTNYKPVNMGTVINISVPVKDAKQPVLLHFFNPGCPCSRFNISNFKRLYNKYNGQVSFVIVVMSSKTYSVKDIQDKFGLDIPVVFNYSLAVACGVYSTPQVALLDAKRRLYYRGNYNRSRYCTDERTDYAKMAITGLLNRDTRLVFNQWALRSYGCQLPNCTR